MTFFHYITTQWQTKTGKIPTPAPDFSTARTPKHVRKPRHWKEFFFNGNYATEQPELPFQIKMDNEGQFLTCLFGYSVPAQFNWDQVIAQKATLSTLSSLSVNPAHLVILMLFVKNCHEGVHFTRKNNLCVITQSFKTKLWSKEKKNFWEN